MAYQKEYPIESYLEDSLTLQIECQSRLGLPGIHIVGLASRELLESRERLASALHHLGVEFPRKRFTLNIRPASVRKPGTGCELALALALLREAKLLRSSCRKIAAWGEITLDGEILETPGVVPAYLSAWKHDSEEFWTSPQNQETLLPVIGQLRECLTGKGPKIRWIQSVQDILSPPAATYPVGSASLNPANEPSSNGDEWFDHVSPELLHFFSVAAAGGHGLAVVGPKGTGKTQAVRVLQALLPQLTPEKWLERMEFAGFRDPKRLLHRRPMIALLAPQSRPNVLVSNGASLLQQARHGILFADEFPELHRDTREALRTVLEGDVAQSLHWFAAGNLCPCGGLPPEFTKDANRRRCRCSRSQRIDYLRRWSGPILDRTDLAALMLPSKRRIERSQMESVLQAIGTVRTVSERLWGRPIAHLGFADLPESLRDAATQAGTLSIRDRLKQARIAVTLQLLHSSRQTAPQEPVLLDGPADWSPWLEQASRLRPEFVLFPDPDAHDSP